MVQGQQCRPQSGGNRGGRQPPLDWGSGIGQGHCIFTWYVLVSRRSTDRALTVIIWSPSSSDSGSPRLSLWTFLQIGGAYLFPPPDFNLNFLSHVRSVLKERGIDVSIVMLEYSKLPISTLPAVLIAPLIKSVAY